MPSYPNIDDLEIEIRTGTGVAVIVEGKDYAQDAHLYDQWFNNLARQVTFFPQNGWPEVVKAVAELRQRCPGQPIYGIIDRDFAEDTALDADFASLGILRIPRYTVENYLLEPACWAQVFALIFRPYQRQGGVPQGWDNALQALSHIEQAFRTCLGLAAYNGTIRFGVEQYVRRTGRLPNDTPEYATHPHALAQAADRLRNWGRSLSISEDLGSVFECRLHDLQQGDLRRWHKEVSGKYVLEELHRQFPHRPGQGVFDLGHYVVLYLDKCPDPPRDLATLIDRIIQAAGR